MLIRWSHHRQQHLKHTARQLHRFLAGPALKFSAGVTRRFLRWWRRLTVWQRLALAGAVSVALFLILPNIKGGLKVLGFLEPDFIKSSSGALFETNRESQFAAFIGDASDTTKSQLRLRVGPGEFNLTLLAPQATAEGAARPATSGASLLTLPASAQEATTASSTVGAQLAPNYQEALQEIRETQFQYATMSARLATLSAQLDILLTQATALTQEALSSLERVDQSLFGPYETIRARGVLGGGLTYYIEQHQLVEQWRIDDKTISNLPLKFQSEVFTLQVKPDQTWEMVAGDQVVMRIETKLTLAKGKEQSLSQIPEARYLPNSDGYSLNLVLPTDVVGKAELYPFRLTRRFIPVETKEVWTRDERVAFVFGNGLASSTIPVGPHPKYLAHWKGHEIVYDADLQNVIETDGSDMVSLFTNHQLTGLACGETRCVMAEGENLTWFVPEEIKAATPGADINTLVATESLGEGPAGGLAIADDTLFRTVNVNPGGNLLTRRLGETTEVALTKEPFVYAEAVSINRAGTYWVFWANGQLQVGGRGLALRSLSLDEKPLAISVGDDFNIYLVLPVKEAVGKAIVRLTPGLGIEVLPGLVGNFTTVAAREDGLVVGLGFGEEGVLVALPWSVLRWIPLTQYED